MEENFSNELIEKFERMLEANDFYYFDSEEFVEIIEYYLDYADLEYALKALKFATDQYPENVDIKIKWLEYLVATKNLKESARLIDELTSIVQNDTDFLLAIAQYWSAKKNHKQAIKYYEEALSNKEELDYIYNAIGNEYLEMDDLNKALFHFNKSLEINPQDEYAFFSIIHCYENLNNPEKSIEFLKKFIEENPFSEQAWFQLGLKQYQLKNYYDAYQSFDFAIVIQPEAVIYYFHKAEALEALGYWEEAFKVYKDALEYEDNKANLFQRMAICKIQNEELHKALKLLRRAIQEDPSSYVVWNDISTVYEKLECFQEALHAIQKAVDLDSENIDYLRKKTYLHIKLQLFEEAIEDFIQLIQLSPSSFSHHYAFSELLISIGELESAKNYLEKFIKRFNRAEFYYQLSYAYLFLGDEENAIKFLDRAVHKNRRLLEDSVQKFPLLSNIAEVYTKK